MPSSLRGEIEPWPSGDLGGSDPLTPRVARAIFNNAGHLVDSQCQHLASMMQRSGVYRIAAASTTRPQLVWRSLVPVTVRPSGVYALWVVQLLVSSATAGSVIWKVGARRPGDMRSTISGPSEGIETINSTTPVWTDPILVRPPSEGNTPRPEPSSAAVGVTPDLVLQVGVGYAEIGIWATGSVVPRLSGVSVREFGGGT